MLTLEESRYWNLRYPELNLLTFGQQTMKKLILIFALNLVATIATADYAIRGEGNFSCPDYVSARQTNNAKLYSSISWVQGFITGVNYQNALPEGSDSFIGQDLTAASVVTWLENYCRSNPQDYLADAAEALIVELKEKG
jgi:hypothetical protein